MINAPSFPIQTKKKQDRDFWFEWAAETFTIRNRFAHRLQERQDDPFAYNEPASVSVLANAAARLGYLSLCDYRENKHHRSDRRKTSQGRIDLYVMRERWQAAFEAKSLYSFQKNRILDARKEARACANCITTARGYNLRSALVISNYWYDEGDIAKHQASVEGEYADADVSWHFEKFGFAAATGLYFWFDR